VSNYTKSTNFSAKDTLPLNDPAKIIKGTEFDTEFNAIATAITSKSDAASPTFTGTPVAPTASPGTNTTQLATTAFVTSATAAERTATATLTNKTLTTPVIGSIVNTGTLTLPTSTDTLVGRATTDTLTNKTVALGSNTVSGNKAQFNTAVTDTDFVFANDFTGSNQSLATAGYQKLPGGLIMQWGGITSTIDTVESFTFSIAFPTACVFISTQRTDASGGDDIHATNYSTTGFDIDRTNGIDGSVPLKYLAIGY
jgi:hypothetical protein